MRSLAHLSWVRRGSVARFIAAAAFIVSATVLSAAEALFPQPLHLTRRIDDPVSHSSTTVQEYCAGNQVVTIEGDRITIADHGRQELTEIDRAAGTYSVTSFADLASAESSTAMPLARRKPATTTATPRERWTVASNEDSAAVTFDGSANTPAKMNVRFDRNVRVSKAAFEVLIGASFPHSRTDVHDALLSVGERRGEGGRRIATNAIASNDAYALPMEQTVTFDIDGESITIRSTVLDVRSELVPPGTLTIPPGSRLVESHAVQLARELREVDQLPGTPSH